MRGRWAAGIMPRNFCWVLTDHLAVSERPGGYAPNHRKVRRQEELLWLRAQGFTRVVSLLASTHNLHAYGELGIQWSRFPMSAPSETPALLRNLYPALHGWLRSGERVLVHQEELGDGVMGVVAGYLLWSEILPDGPRAIAALEQLLRRQMGTPGRLIVAAVVDVPPLKSFAHGAAQSAPEPASAIAGEPSPPEGAEATAPRQSESEPNAGLVVVPDLELAQPESQPDAGPTAASGLAEPEPEPHVVVVPDAEPVAAGAELLDTAVGAVPAASDPDEQAAGREP